MSEESYPFLNAPLHVASFRLATSDVSCVPQWQKHYKPLREKERRPHFTTPRRAPVLRRLLKSGRILFPATLLSLTRFCERFRARPPPRQPGALCELDRTEPNYTGRSLDIPVVDSSSSDTFLSTRIDSSLSAFFSFRFFPPIGQSPVATPRRPGTCRDPYARTRIFVITDERVRETWVSTFTRIPLQRNIFRFCFVIFGEPCGLWSKSFNSCITY